MMTYRAYLKLVPLKIVLRKGGKKEDDLSLHNCVDVGVWRIIHGRRPDRSLRTSIKTSTSRRRFEE